MRNKEKRMYYRKGAVAAVLAFIMLLVSVSACFADESASGNEVSGNEVSGNAAVSSDTADEAETDSVSFDEVSGNAAVSENSSGEVSDNKADWTVLVYLCGTDLESEKAMATANLEEVAATQPSDAVNFVFQTGGTKTWHTGELGFDVDPQKTQRYIYDKDGFSLVEEKPLQNMASGKTLSEFISWGAEEYPAEKYMLVLWDHGGGSEQGVIVDELHGRAMLTLNDLEASLDSSGVELETVMLDCCLMSSLETAEALKDHAHYMVASEETVADEGADWNVWMQYLYDVPDCDGAEFGRRVCDSAQQKYAEMGDELSSMILTYSVTDLNEIENVEKAFDDFFTVAGGLVENPADYSDFMYATSFAERYAGGKCSMVDIADMADKARESGVINEEAIALERAVNKAVVYNVKGKGRSFSHGLSYFDGVQSYPEILDHYTRAVKSAPYLAYLDAVHMDWTAPDWVYEETGPLEEMTYEDYGVETELGINEDGDLTLEITNGLQTIQGVDYCLYRKNDDGRWIELGIGSDVGTESIARGMFTASFNGVWPAIGDELCCMDMSDETNGYVRYKTPVLLENIDEEHFSSSIFDGEVIDGDILMLSSAYINGEDDGYYELYGFALDDVYVEDTELPNRATFSLKDLEGSEMRLLYPASDELTGNMIYEKADDTIEVSRELYIEEKPIPAGEYEYVFAVYDVLGRIVYSDTATLIWDGETAEYILPDTAEEAQEAEETEETEAEGAEEVEETAEETEDSGAEASKEAETEPEKETEAEPEKKAGAKTSKKSTTETEKEAEAEKSKEDEAEPDKKGEAKISKKDKAGAEKEAGAKKTKKAEAEKTDTGEAGGNVPDTGGYSEEELLMALYSYYLEGLASGNTETGPGDNTGTEPGGTMDAW